MPRSYRFVVGANESRQRLDRYLVSHLPQSLSRAAVQRAIQQGAVTVEGRAAKVHRLLKTGEAVIARFDQLGAAPTANPVLIPEPIPLAIVYEDDDVLVVNKPPGLVTHPAPGHWSGTLVNAVLWHLMPEASQTVPPSKAGRHARWNASGSVLPRAGIVHRLDKDTSGLLVVAKTEAALRALAKQLKARTMKRHYLAVVEGHMESDEGRIDAAIGRHPTHRKQMAIRYLGGRQAATSYRVLKRVATAELRYTVIEVSLETGRTHQVRVHLSHVGHPVLGDPVYGKHPIRHWLAHGISRQLLHAYAMRFHHPRDGRPIAVTADVPADMQPWLEGIRLPRLPGS